MLLERIQLLIKKLFGRLKDKNSFVYGMSWTFSATSLSLLLQLIFSPILSRIYGPEAYGEFAIFNLIASNLSSFATLGYTEALLTKNSKKDYYYLSLFILFSTLLVLTTISIVFIPFQSFWFNLFPKIENLKWFPIIVIIVFLYSINAIFSKWNIKGKRFNRNAKNVLSGNLFSKIYAIIFGLKVSNSGIGIISAELIKTVLFAFFFLTYKQIKSIIRKLLQTNKYTVIRSIIVAKQTINYPKFIWPGQWISLLSNQLPILFFTGFFSLNEVGALTFAGSLIAIPGRLFGKAISPVFFQKSQEIYESGDLITFARFTKKISFYLFLLGILAYLPIILFGTYIFDFVFGDDWIISGKIASYLSIAQLSMFSVAPIGSVFMSLNQEKKLFYFQIFLFIIRLISLSLSVLLGMNFLDIILIYSLVNFLIYLVMHFIVRNMLNVLKQDSI